MHRLKYLILGTKGLENQSLWQDLIPLDERENPENHRE